MSLKEDENKRFKDYTIRKVQLIKNLMMSTPFEEGEFITSKVGMIVRFSP